MTAIFSVACVEG